MKKEIKPKTNSKLSAMDSNIIRDHIVGSEIPIIPEVDQSFRYRLPRQGKIHLGVKAITKSGKEYPKATDYFVLPDQLRSDEGFKKALEALGESADEPRQLPIMLPCDAIAGNLQSSCDYYGSTRGLVCRTFDGVTCKYVDQQTGELKEQPCKMRSGCEHYARGDCHWIHRLRFVIPDAAGVGVWQIDTTSPNNRANLLTEMAQIKGLMGGRLAGIDLLLTLEPREFTVPVKDKGGIRQVKTVCHLLHIRSRQTLRELRNTAVTQPSFDSAELEDFDLSPNDIPVVEVEEVSEDVETEVETEGEAEPDFEQSVNKEQMALEDALKDELFGVCRQIVENKGVPRQVVTKMVEKVSGGWKRRVPDLNAKELAALRDMLEAWKE